MREKPGPGNAAEASGHKQLREMLDSELLTGGRVETANAIGPLCHGREDGCSPLRYKGGVGKETDHNPGNFLISYARKSHWTQKGGGNQVVSVYLRPGYLVPSLHSTQKTCRVFWWFGPGCR